MLENINTSDFAKVDFSSPSFNPQEQTAGYSILNQPVNAINAPGAALVGGLGENLGSPPVNVNTCNLFGGQNGGSKRRGKRGRKSKRSRKLRRSNKSRLSTKSNKSKSKRMRSKVKTVRKSFKKSVKRKSKKSMK